MGGKKKGKLHHNRCKTPQKRIFLDYELPKTRVFVRWITNYLKGGGRGRMSEMH